MQTSASRSASEAGGSGGGFGDDGRGAGSQDGSKTTRGRALELVVVRGAEVLGVRHLLAGASAWLGSADSIAPVSMAGFGGRPVAIGEATTSRFYVQVPPNARARLRSADGLPRILAGAQRLQLRRGDTVVIVLGPVSVRARLVAVDGVGRTPNLADRALRWVAVLSVLYLVALGLMAWLGSTSDASVGPRGELQHAASTPAKFALR
jgi:hypothetical protein